MGINSKLAVWMVVPLLLATMAVGALLWHQAGELAQQQEATLRTSLLAAKRQELEHHVSLALTALERLANEVGDEAAKQEQARALLRGMNYGTDGYFFVYDFRGNNLVHPRLPQLEGQNLWDLRDPQGLPVIRQLIGEARKGGGFVRYQWEKPSTGKVTDKLSYAIAVDRWGWMIGTGLYLDDVEEAALRIRADLASNIREAMQKLAAVALVALAVVGAGGIATTVSETRLANARLKDLNRRIVTLQEEERRRVARELHDGISQLLVSAKFHLEMAEEHAKAATAGIPPGLSTGISRVGDAVAEIRAMSHHLRSAVLDNLGLVPAIEQLVREFSLRTGILVEVDRNLPDRRLPGDVELTLFRIAQEAFTNIERHARADLARLSLTADEGRILLAVSDNGMGMESRAGTDHRPGIGLSNLRERAEHLGGSLDLAPAAGGGTCLSSWLPLA